MSEWIECGLPFDTYGKGPDFEDIAEASGGLVGMLVETDEGQFLIGHINSNRGVCDCCTEFQSNAMIRRYRRVWSPERRSVARE